MVSGRTRVAGVLPVIPRASGRRLAVLLQTIAALAIAASAASAQARSELLTLDRAIAIALASNRPAQMSALEEDRVGDEVEALRTSRLPKLDVKVLEGGILSPLEFSFREGVFGTFPATGPIPFADVRVDSPRSLATGVLFTGVQPLTQLRRISQGEKLLNLGKGVAAEKTRAQRQTLVADVRRAYYGLQQTRAGLVVVDEAVAQLTELERVVAGYVETQVALPSDHLAVRTEQARTTHETLVLRNLEATLKERINVLLGRDLATPFDVVELPAAVPTDLDLAAAVARAKAARPAVREAALNVERATADRRLKDQERTPDISLMFTFARLFNVDVLPHNIASASVIVSWEPFAWGRRQHEMDAKTRTLEQAKLGLAEAGALVELDVRVKYRKLMETREALELAALARATAAERLRVATDRYQVEATLFKDVLEARTAVAKATQEYQQTLGDFWTARAGLDEALGDQP